MFTLEELLKQREARMNVLRQEIGDLYNAARERETELAALSGEYRLLAGLKNDGYELNKPVTEESPAGDQKAAKTALKGKEG
jgi:hypothetical protein